jgi:hypothetical protein
LEHLEIELYSDENGRRIENNDLDLLKNKSFSIHIRPLNYSGARTFFAEGTININLQCALRNSDRKNIVLQLKFKDCFGGYGDTP